MSAVAQKDTYMSELATEIGGAGETIASVEFFGKTFQERRTALQKIDAFREQGRQALADSVAVLVGQSVMMKFRPSTAALREYPQVSVPCYSFNDIERKPLERQVTIQDVDTDRGIVQVGAGEYYDERSDRTWWVQLGGILDITLDEPGAE